MAGYNPLSKVLVNYNQVGMCDICGHRLTTECHRTEESELWYAAHIAAEQMLHNANTNAPTLNELHDAAYGMLDFGTRTVILGGEVLELDTYLDARYYEEDTELPF